MWHYENASDFLLRRRAFWTRVCVVSVRSALDARSQQVSERVYCPPSHWRSKVVARLGGLVPQRV
jgi:hypothetical protein